MRPGELTVVQTWRLVRDLSRLRWANPLLIPGAVRWVLSGKGGEILLKLAATRRGGKALGLTCSESFAFWRKVPRCRLLRSFRADQAAAALRLAQVYEAASRKRQKYLTLQWLGAPTWLEIFLQEGLWRAVSFAAEDDHKPLLEARLLEEMLAADEADAGLVVRGALLAEPDEDVWRSVFADLGGIGEAIARHPEVVREVLSRPAKARVAALEVMRDSRADLRTAADVLVELALGSARTVRAAAEPLVRQVRAAARPFLRENAEGGSPSVRDRALRLLWRLDGEAARAFLEERKGQEGSKKLRATIEELLAGPAPEDDGGDFGALELEPLREIDPRAPLPVETRDALRDLCRWWNEKAAAYVRSRKRRKKRLVRPPRLSRAAADRAWRELQGWVYRKLWIFKAKTVRFHPLRSDLQAFFGYHVQFEIGLELDRLVRAFVRRPELDVVHFLRLMCQLRYFHPSRIRSHPLWYLDPGFEAYAQLYRRSHRPFGLRELAAVSRAIGIDDGWIGRARLMGTPGFFCWEDEAVWPYFAEHPELLEEALGLRPPKRKPGWWANPNARRDALDILTSFPVPPPAYHRLLWDLALGTSRAERPRAQAALEKLPNPQPKIVAALANSKKDVRAAAALWLGRIGSPAERTPDGVVAQLEAAFAREKQEEVRSALLTALEQLGRPAAELLDRRELLEEVRAGLARRRPASIDWLVFDLLPEVRWDDTGEPVDPDVVQWLVVRSARLGEPDPDPMLRHWCRLFRAADREALGRFVLDAWIARDSGVRAKGILAVAAVCCGAAACRAVDSYLRHWYGKRLAQCKALLRMLSWIDHPRAVQLLAAVARRFRSESLRQEAEELVQALAERRGWTPAEIGDRSVPTAGFETGDGPPRLVLDCGNGRVYTAVLSSTLDVVLRNPAGKVVKSLPSARKGDAPELVKDARETLSQAKEEVREAVRLQGERLYEAMCTQRSWTVPSWRETIAEHPIVGRFAERVVWTAYDPAAGPPAGRPVATFRPMDDGTLTDADDGEVKLDDRFVVRLSHDALVSAEAAEKWVRHLADYEVEPLFRQFSGDGFRLPEGRRADTELDDFEGHMLMAFDLRERATRLGYVRGPVDGGWFCTYHKGFPTLELDAVLEFTGSALPEENRLVALCGTSFVRKRGEPQAGAVPWVGKLSLGEVPPALLGECWNDLRTLSGLGSGYDPKWETKTGWW